MAANRKMNLLKKFMICACVMTALSCGEQQDMLDFAMTGEGLLGKYIYVFATYPSGAPYDVYLVVADDKNQVRESLVGLNITEAFGNLHVSEEGIAFMCFTATAYINIPPYELPWISSSPPITPTGAFFASNYMIQGAIANAAFYQYLGGWSYVGAFNNGINIMAADYSTEEETIYTVDANGNVQRYLTGSMTFDPLYLPVYTPAWAPSVRYLHRGRKHMYVGTTSRLYFCGNPTGNASEQYNRLGSDISILLPAQNATSYCVLSDESRIFALTTETASPFTMRLHMRIGGSWLELLSFAGAAAGDVMNLFDMRGGKIVLWVSTASASAGIYVFDYEKMKLNRVLINPAYTVKSVVVK